MIIIHAVDALNRELQEHANDYKVWNLSLGLNEVCSLDEFSSMAEELDNLQEQYQVSFVISAGNYDSRLSWTTREKEDCLEYTPTPLP